MEYMATYGWAIVAALIVVVVIYEFGVFNPVGAPTKGMRGFGSVRPLDWACKTDTSQLEVQWVNAFGERIEIAAPNGGCSYRNSTYLGGVRFNISEYSQVVCRYNGISGCSNTGRGSRFECQPTLQWTTSANKGIQHNESGSVWGPAE